MSSFFDFMFEFYALLLDPKLSKIAQEVLEKREQQRRTLANQLFILHSIFEKFKRDDDDNYGISVVELFPMMEKLGLKLEREKLEDLVVKYDPEGTHFIRPEIFATLLLEHMLIFDDQKVSFIQERLSCSNSATETPEQCIKSIQSW